MYYIYGLSGPSLLIESTDCMIISTASVDDRYVLMIGTCWQVTLHLDTPDSSN